jgi:predicted alpha/beta-fold hydrolase
MASLPATPAPSAPAASAASASFDAPPAAPRWLPGGHLQTIWPALCARRHHGPPPRWRRERWTTPDGDFVDADWLVDGAASPARPEAASAAAALTPARAQPAATPAVATAPGERPLLVLFHGLEGSSGSHYCQAFADRARARDWALVVPHFRGCSGELNLAPRAYHSGDHAEIGWMLAQVRARHAGPVVAVGVSLGGNALLRWAEEAGHAAAAQAAAVVSICAPIDLAASGHAIGRGWNRWLYTPMFLRTMKPKALRKLAQHPGLFDRDRLLAARTLFEFDNVFTAPLHGFRDTDDYWRRASALPALGDIRIPALVLNALNDPFVPAACLPRALPPGSPVTLWQPRHGGHVGFPAGWPPGHVLDLPRAVIGWLGRHLPG